MFDLYIQIIVALLLAFLLGFLIAKMWVYNRQNEYLAKFTQIKTKLNTEEEFRQQQTHKINLLEEREQHLMEAMDKLTSIKTSLEVEATALNKNIKDKQVEVTKVIDNKKKIEEQLEIKTTQNNQLVTDLQLTTQQKDLLNTQFETLSENHQNALKTLTFMEEQATTFAIQQDQLQQLIGTVDELNSVKTSLDTEIARLTQNIKEEQDALMEVADSKEEIEKFLEIKTTQNNQLVTDLQLTTQQKNSLTSQFETLSENHQNALNSIEFMEEQARIFGIQQGQLQQSLQQSTQQYESMMGKINTLGVNEKEAVEKIHDIEKKYLDLESENESIEEEKTNYGNKLFIVNKERIALEAHTLVRNHTFGAISVAIIPIPFLDLATLLGIQIKMLRALAEKYQIPFSENKVKSLIFPLLSSTLTMTGAIVFSSFIKIIPGIGQASGMVSISVLAGTTTYAVGEIFVEHFESGGTFLDFDTEKQKVRFKELYEKGKQRLVASEVEEA